MKLKKCPFCGNDAKFEKAGFAPVGGQINSGFVSCEGKNCCVLMFGETKRDAVLKWNKRKAGE